MKLAAFVALESAWFAIVLLSNDVRHHCVHHEGAIGEDVDTLFHL